MFDFCIIISSQPPMINRIKQHDSYMQRIPHKTNMISGQHFVCQYDAHTDVPASSPAASDGIHCCIIGRAFTNNLYFHEHGVTLKELTGSDLIDMYKRLGSGFIKYVKGIFLVVIIDEVKRNYCAYTSKSGLYRLYYTATDDRLVISSSLSSVVVNLAERPEVDGVALMQHAVFEHTLGERTIFRGISTLDNYQYLQYNLATLSIVSYYNVSEKLTSTPKFSWYDTKHLLPGAFNSSMDAITLGVSSLNSALTGGYDSRTILSYLLNRRSVGCHFYTWAAEKSWEDAKVAQHIATSMNLPYETIELGDQMLDHYHEYSDMYIYWSDGSGSINRTNQMYSHERLSQISRNLVTGYFGSELFRPLHRSNVMISNSFTDTLLNGQREERLNALATQKTNALQSAFVRKHMAEFIHVGEEYFRRLDVSKQNYLNLLHYLIKTGFWKFFGQEIHSQRIHTRAVSPYIDDDFVDFVVQTPIKSIQEESYRKPGINSLRGQALYHPIMKHNCPSLMSFPTNRGFSPRDYDSILFPLNVLIKHKLSRRRQRASGIMGFNSRAWNIRVFNERKDILSMQNDVFQAVDVNDSDASAWYSLKRYLVVIS